MAGRGAGRGNPQPALKGWAVVGPRALRAGFPPPALVRLGALRAGFPPPVPDRPRALRAGLPPAPLARLGALLGALRAGCPPWARHGAGRAGPGVWLPICWWAGPWSSRQMSCAGWGGIRGNGTARFRGHALENTLIDGCVNRDLCGAAWINGYAGQGINPFSSQYICGFDGFLPGKRFPGDGLLVLHLHTGASGVISAMRHQRWRT